jgi:hypothetical protein
MNILISSTGRDQNKFHWAETRIYPSVPIVETRIISTGRDQNILLISNGREQNILISHITGPQRYQQFHMQRPEYIYQSPPEDTRLSHYTVVPQAETKIS